MEQKKKSFHSLLVIDDDKSFCASLERAFREEFNILIAHSPDEARRIFWRADIILLDVRLKEEPDNNEGIELLSEFHNERPQLPIIMATAFGDMKIAVEAMKIGAIDFLPKPLDLTKLRTTIKNSLEQANLRRLVGTLEREIKRIEPVEFVGASKKIAEIRKLIDYIAKDGRINVLLTGETGTGKELVARLIHRNGWRSNGSYEAISLAALAPSIIESELFGHEKGAFTDARERKIGFIELADKGVLFLDDIDIAPLDVQVKLLRFLEERSFCRSGGTHLIDIDVQLISATNQNLLQLTKDGKFRKDLYFRLKTVEVHIPPLREHAEDIPDLVSHFLRLLQKQGRTQIEACSLEALDAMLSYQWPGNIRELENCIENAVLFAKIKGHEKIELEDLPGELWHEAKTEKKALNIELAEEGINLEEKKARYELSYIESALEKSRGHKTEAWRILGLHDRFVLRRRVKAIERRFSQLIEEFPLIKKAFSK